MARSILESDSSLAQRLVRRVLRLIEARPERVASMDISPPSEAYIKKTTRADGGPATNHLGVKEHANKISQLVQAAERGRLQRYADYREMDLEVPELHRARKVLTQFAFGGKFDRCEPVSYRLFTDGARPEVVRVTDQITKALKLHNVIRQIIGEGVFMGDSFTELDFFIERGGKGRLVNQVPLWPEFTYVHEVSGYVAYYRIAASEADEGRKLLPYQVIHYAHDKERGDRYGTSLFYAGAKRWRSGSAIEDVLSILALTSAREKNTHIWPFASEVEEDEIWEWLRDVQAETEADWFWEAENNSRLQKRVVPQLETADAFLPHKIDEDIQVMPGVVKTAAADLRQLTEVLGFFRDSYFVATGVPASLVGFERNVNAKSTLGGQMSAFVLTVRDLQMDAAEVLNQFYTRGLLAQNIVPEEGEVTIEMPPTTQLDEQMRAEVVNLRCDALKKLLDAGVPPRMAIEQTLQLTPAELDQAVDDFERLGFKAAINPHIEKKDEKDSEEGVRLGLSAAEILEES